MNRRVDDELMQVRIVPPHRYLKDAVELRQCDSPRNWMRRQMGGRAYFNETLS